MTRRRRTPRLAAAAVAVAVTIVAAACTTDDSELAQRPYEVHVPPGYAEGTPAPLLIVLHGFAFEGKVQTLYFGLDRVTDPAGMLYVAPTGTTDDQGRPFWNATDACCAPPGTDVDDSAYLRAIIDEVSRDYAVDDRRIFVMGHSNGGFMAYRMACDHADVVAGVVSLEGAMAADPSACDPSEPVSVLQIHGTADNVIRYEGGTKNDADPSAAPYPGAQQSVAMWAGHNGCDTPPSAPAPGPVIDDTKAAAQVTSFANCDDGSAVELWTVPDGTHVPSLAAGFTQAAVDFLMAHPKPD